MLGVAVQGEAGSVGLASDMLENLQKNGKQREWQLHIQLTGKNCFLRVCSQELKDFPAGGPPSKQQNWMKFSFLNTAHLRSCLS